ncbi:MAG: peptide chain release factor N(5)-glutamine methyltransferase [Acidobacteriota bacterium]
MTLRERMQQGEARLLAGPHPERARRDAESLLLHLIGKNRAWLIAHGEDEFGGCDAIRYAAMVERRFAGEPIQYITGECEFFGLPFHVTPAVLIPRPETEHLVEQAILLSSHFADGARIADVGTGSGAIAVALAHALPGAKITAIDLSREALSIARENADRNAVADRIRFIQGDLLEPVTGEQFDLIVSNPPYVASSDHDLLAAEVRDHEPHLALFAGEDGLALYRRLIPLAASSLVVGGYLALEIGYGQAENVRALLAGASFSSIEFRPDLQGIPRVASAQLL